MKMIIDEECSYEDGDLEIALTKYGPFGECKVLKDTFKEMIEEWENDKYIVRYYDWVNEIGIDIWEKE